MINIDKSTASQRNRWAVAFLASIIFITFSRLCVAEFTTWDDAQNISQNPRMQQPWLETVKHYLGHSEFGLYIPVTYAVWAGLARVSEIGSPDATGNAFNSWIFHTFNVALHMLNTMLVLRLIDRLIRVPLAAFFGAALFALHPVQVETVGWVSGTKDLLCWLGVAIALNVYADLIERSATGSIKSFWISWRFAVVFAVMILAILSKPTAMVLSALMIVIDHFFYRTKFRLAVVRAIPMFLVSLGAMVLARQVQAAKVFEPDLPGRLLVAGDALSHYLLKTVWPIGLTFDYGRTPEYVLAQTATRWIWSLPLIAIGAALLCWRRNPQVTGAAAIFVIGVSPMLGLVPFMFQSYSTVADHYLYFSMVGVSILVAVALARIPAWQAWLCAPALIVMAILSFRQTEVWTDDESLNTHGLKINPRSYMSHNNLGVALIGSGRLTEADFHFTRAIELNPKMVMSYTNRAQLRMQFLKDYSGAIEDLTNVVELMRAENSSTPRGMATTLILLVEAQLRSNQLEAAEITLRQARALDPNHENLPKVLLLMEHLRSQSTTKPGKF